MTGLTSVLSPFSRQGVPTLPLLLLLVYAVASSLVGASIRQLENQSRHSIELSYAASTLEKDLVSLMRDAQAMVSAPSELRMQALLINLEEYANTVDDMSAITSRQQDIRAPLNALEDALPDIRRVVLQAARTDGDRSAAIQQEQVLALTRIDTQMGALVTEIENQLGTGQTLSGAMADRLRVLSWIINILAVCLVAGLIYGALRKDKSGDLSAQIAE